MRDLGIIFAGKFGSRGNQQISSALDELNRPISAPAAGTLEAPLVGRFFFVCSSDGIKKLPRQC